jgi:hypothetical protein
MSMVDQKPAEPTEGKQVGYLYHLPRIQAFFGLFLVLGFIFSQTGYRANAFLEARSIVTSSSIPSAVVRHDIQFDVLGSASLGSILVEYCATSPLLEIVCIPPVGLNSAGANLQFQSGDTGFSIHPSTSANPNIVLLTRTSSSSSIGTKQYRLGNITNPSASNTTTYVRIRLYASTDATGLHNDFGGIAFSTNAALTVGAYVPPFLILCTGVTVAVDCSSSTGAVVDMGELSRVAANSAETQFAVATNSFNGYSAAIVGSTMVAGNKIIPALASNAGSVPGSSQFGINLRKNTSPNVGSDAAGAGTGAPSVGYDTPNSFRFQSGDTIASSPISSEWNKYTISYLVNVSNVLPAGRYASTLTVIATTTF